MSQSKSPFYIVKEFISPLMCEDIVYRLNHSFPDEDKDGQPLKTIRLNNLTEIRVLPKLEELVPKLEAYYNFETHGIESFDFEWYVEGFKPEGSKCKNFTYLNKKWKRCSDIDFTGVIFLNDYNNAMPFDPDYEVCGGKLEFYTHQFGFNPQRGTLIFFPECPNFINTTGPIEAGELTQIRFHIVPKTPYNYDMKMFPGDYRVWFKD